MHLMPLLLWLVNVLAIVSFVYCKDIVTWES